MAPIELSLERQMKGKEGLTPWDIEKEGITFCGIWKEGLTSCGKEGLTPWGIEKEGLTPWGEAVGVRVGVTVDGDMVG
ncbi:hypothetical protein CYMTET_12608 [Cymbomonas tetramitiformis]|uniref:Uncharacterized protein n=1 Tax=Cymbomonas tetramitiformis TaxID=36881 RepID=A0AAE0LBW5_9CHLO|nr:hypothetical protein CYMTET_12608 [Cymbomonas tetramitiformis]